MLVPLKIKPGIYRNGTNYQAAGRWYGGNLMRFFQGDIMPVGGWRKASATQMTGKARGMHAWLTNASDKWAAIGTHSKLYVYNGGSLYDITPAGFTPGREDSFFGVGYGFGPYNAGLYGTPPSTTTVLDAATWSLDNYGNYLISCHSQDGKLYVWQNDTGVLPTRITNSPTGNFGAFVTPERAIVVYKGGDVAWCDSNDYTIWAPSATNSAGGFSINTRSKLFGHVKVQEGTVIGSATGAYLFYYTGPPTIYGLRVLGEDCGFISPHAAVGVRGGAIWMGQNAFWSYDGGAVQQIPSEVHDYVFGDMNRVQTAKFYAGHNPNFSEIWFYYCSANSTEIDRAVVYNYQEDHWNIMNLARTAWVGSGVFQYPLAVSPDGYIYEHENGWTNNGAEIGVSRYLEAGPVEIPPGDNVMRIRQLLPDENTSGAVRVRFKTNFAPEGSEYNYGPYSLSAYTSLRITGRAIAPKLESTADQDFRVGTMRFDVTPGGRR